MKRMTPFKIRRKALLLLASVCTASFIYPSLPVPAGDFSAAKEYLESDIDEEVYEGMWVGTEFGYKIYLPSKWQMLDTGDESLAGTGIFLMAASTDDENTRVAMSVVSPEGDTDVLTTEEIFDEISSEKEYENPEYVSLNGIEAVKYDSGDGTACAVSFVGNGGELLTVLVGWDKDTDEEDILPVCSNIFSSISPFDGNQ